MKTPRDLVERCAIPRRVVLLFAGLAGLVALVVTVAYHLLPSCGLAIAHGWLETCPRAPQAVSGAYLGEVERMRALEDRIGRLERELAGLPGCLPSSPASLETRPEQQAQPEPSELDESTPEQQAQPEPSEFDQRLADNGGEVSEELTVTLIWDDESDLDLAVHCPDGGTAGVLGTGCGGGVLDVDANGYFSGGLRMMARPVENVRFSSPPPGEYWIRVFVDEGYAGASGYDRQRNLGRHPFRVRVLTRSGEEVFQDIHPGVGNGDVWMTFALP